MIHTPCRLEVARQLGKHGAPLRGGAQLADRVSGRHATVRLDALLFARFDQRVDPHTHAHAHVLRAGRWRPIDTPETNSCSASAISRVSVARHALSAPARAGGAVGVHESHARLRVTVPVANRYSLISGSTSRVSRFPGPHRPRARQRRLVARDSEDEQTLDQLCPHPFNVIEGHVYGERDAWTESPLRQYPGQRPRVDRGVFGARVSQRSFKRVPSIEQGIEIDQVSRRRSAHQRCNLIGRDLAFRIDADQTDELLVGHELRCAVDDEVDQCHVRGALHGEPAEFGRFLNGLHRCADGCRGPAEALHGELHRLGRGTEQIEIVGETMADMVASECTASGQEERRRLTEERFHEVVLQPGESRGDHAFASLR